MADITQRLPPELLAEILEHVSVPDVLRFEQVRRHRPRIDGFTERGLCLQVNRVFRNAILGSP